MALRRGVSLDDHGVAHGLSSAEGGAGEDHDCVVPRPAADIGGGEAGRHEQGGAVAAGRAGSGVADSEGSRDQPAGRR